MDIKKLNSSIVKEYQGNLKKNNNTIVVDIDGVVASKVKGKNYENAKPIKKNISLINKLKKKGIKIIFFTARGTETGVDWELITKKQFKKWNIAYDEIKFGKPAADLYIDDKAAVPSILSALVNKK